MAFHFFDFYARVAIAHSADMMVDEIEEEFALRV
jgi:hypothetical protein